jgi:hypothetical protein
MGDIVRSSDDLNQPLNDQETCCRSLRFCTICMKAIQTIG